MAPTAAQHSRSWLLVHPGRLEQLEVGSCADEVILDLEDAVDPSSKSVARSDVIAWLESSSAWVRINDIRSAHWSDDVEALRGSAGLRGVVLAKTEAASDVERTARRLGGVPVVALLESALGIEEATAVARASGTFRLAFGSGDYRRDTGTSTHDLAMSYPRSRLVVASRAAGLPGPIDGPGAGLDQGALEEQCALAVALGLTGKLCLDEEQTTVINESMSPTLADISWATAFIAEFEARGRLIRDGSDLPRLGSAERILERAGALGLALS